MGDTERDALKGAAADAGLGLTYSIGLKADMDLASEDAATRKKGVAFLQDVARAMKYLGGTVLAGINYSSWPRRERPRAAGYQHRRTRRLSAAIAYVLFP